MNITGESFDYGPWRWLPEWDAGFTAAYFDQTGLYAFGRQPESLHWNCGQFAVALRLLADAPPLLAAMERFGPLYMQAIARRWVWRMGLRPRGPDLDAKVVVAAEALMRETRQQPDAFFHRHRYGRNAEGALAEALAGYAPVEEPDRYWDEAPAESLLIEEVEALWAAIDRHDDWAPLEAKVAAIRHLGRALGEPPPPAGHMRGTPD